LAQIVQPVRAPFKMLTQQAGFALLRRTMSQEQAAQREKGQRA